MSTQSPPRWSPVFPPGRQALFESIAYSPAVRCGDFVIVAGQVGIDRDGHVVEDPEAQIRLAFEKLEATLKAGGATLKDVCEIKSFHVDMEKHEALFQRIRREIFPEPPYPVFTGLIEVVRLGMPGLLVEVAATAYVPEK